MFGKGKSPFATLANKFEKLFSRNETSSESDSGNVKAAVGQLNLPADYQKQVEKAVQEQLRRQREAELEARRSELLASTKAVTPWKPKARPGDELYPSLRMKSGKESTEKAASTPAKSTPARSTKSPPSASGKVEPSESSGLEPPPIDADEDASMNSVRTSSLKLLLEDLAKDAEVSKLEPSKKSKPLQTMTPAELIETRHRDEEAWRRLIRENTIMAVAASSPTDQDRKKAAEGAKRSAAATQRQKVRFNEKVGMILAPVGRPYAPDEETTKQTGALESDKTKKAA